MKIVKILQDLSKKEQGDLKEYLLDIPKTELVDIIVEMVDNQEPPKPQPEPITIETEIYNKLVEVITTNFKPKVEGRGRKSIFDEVGYVVAVQRVLNNYKHNRTLPTAQYNIQLKQLYLRECYRREKNGEDISNFHRTYIKREVIYNEPKSSPFLNVDEEN